MSSTKISKGSRRYFRKFKQLLDTLFAVAARFAALRELRRDPTFEATPVLMLSARNREADVVGALDDGANDYLTKPFSPAELLARVARLVPEGAAA